MSKVIFKRGTTSELESETLQDGLLSFTTDDGRIHLDYANAEGEIVRRTFYSGKLTFGSHIYDGTEDVDVNIYDGTIIDNKNKGE